MHILYRMRTLAAASLVCICIACGADSYAQTSPSSGENEERTTTAEIDSNQSVNSNLAITPEDPDIEVEDLVLVLKPLTLKQLEHEAAGWLLLLQNKVQQVSEAEIAIKRENRAIDAEKEAIRKIEDAKARLEEAEGIQISAPPNTPEYEDATKKVEAVHNALIEAEAAIEAVTRAEQAVLETPALQSALREAKEEEGVTLAKDILKAAKVTIKEIPVDSPKYAASTEAIDTLAESLRNLKFIRDELQGVAVDSLEYETAQRNVGKARDAVKIAAFTLTQQIPDLVDDTSALTDTLSPEATITDSNPASREQEESEFSEETEFTLDNTTAILDQVDKQITSAEIDLSTIRQAEQKLEQFSANLKETVEQERELKNQLVINVTNLQSEQTAIADRLKVVLDELDAKGGDSPLYRKYIQSISGIEIDVTDTEGLGVRLISWIKSEEGGVRWGRNLMIFFIIVTITVVVAQLFALLLRVIMSRFTQSSSLLQSFVIMVVRRGGIVVGILLALTALEVSLTPILAILGGASFVLAFALQSNLSNVASGLMMMWYKPFDEGDHVQVAGITGFVKSISLTNTIIRSSTYDTFTLPNELVWGGAIMNSTTEGRIRRELRIQVSFNTDLRRVEHLLIDIAKSHSSVLEDPAPKTLIRFGDSFVIIFLRPWMYPKDYDRVPSDLRRMIIERFQQEQITIAIPAAIEFSQDVKSHSVAADLMVDSVTNESSAEECSGALTTNMDVSATSEVEAKT